MSVITFLSESYICPLISRCLDTSFGCNPLQLGFVDLIAIERFEEITGIKFDHSKFNNRREFQEYFQKWLKEEKK